MQTVKSKVTSVRIEPSRPLARREAAIVDQPSVAGRSAKSTHVSQKDALLLLATERFCGRDAQTRLGVDQFKEAFYGLAGAVERDTLSQIATLIRHEPFTPREILMYLALEPVSVCAPLLREAPQFTQLDLVRLIGKCGLNHATEIAKRSDLGPSLVRQLRSLNDVEVNRALKDNKALLDDLSKRSLDKLFDTITAPKRKEFKDASWAQVVETGTKKQVNVPVSVATPTKRAQDTLLKAASRGGRTELTAGLKEGPDEKNHLTPEQFGDAMEKAALSRSRQSQSVLMQKQFGLTFETTQQIFEDNTGDTLAVLMKAVELDAAKANRIALLTFPQIGLSVQNTRRAIRFYAQLTVENCKKAVDLWPKSESRPALYQTAHYDAAGIDRNAASRVVPNHSADQKTSAKVVNY